MVVRSSFVTNSSSSSFVCVDVNSKEIVDILHEFEEEVSEIFECGGVQFISDTEASIYVDDMSGDHPQTPDDIVHVIAGLFSWNYFEEYGYAQEDGEELDMSEYPEIVQRLVECKDEILDKIKNLKYVYDVVYAEKELKVCFSGGNHNVIHVLDLLQKEDVPFGRVYTELPTLNDVFLELTGKELRD